jgi:hypothetical protein
MHEIEKNQQIADRICQEFECDGRKFATGDCVAILDGAIVAVADSLDEAFKQLRSIDPDPNRGLLLEVRPPVMDVIRK